MGLKKEIGIRIAAAVLGILCFVGAARPVSVSAEDYWPSEPYIDSPSAMVIEINTGTVLYEKNSHDRNYPASITKIMTTMLAIENCSMDETVVFSYDAVYGGNEGDTSHIARNMDEELTMEQCLYAVMLESANECAYAVAEHVGEKLGGDYRTFVDLMNERAQELGCTDTHFNNANGLPDQEHWTSAHDMALIAQEAYKNETFRTITGSSAYTIPVTNKCPEPYYCHNHHKMIYPWQGDYKYLYEYCTGGKTGYTAAANSTLVSYAEKDGMALVCVIMNAQSPSHFTDTRALFDYCFDNFQAVNIAENEEAVSDDGLSNAGVLNNNGAFVELDQNAYIILPKNAQFSDATFTLETNIDSKTIARLNYEYAGRSVGNATIVTSGVRAEQNPLEKEENTDSNIKVIQIKPIWIFLILVMLGVLAVLIYFGKRLYDNFYVIRHTIETKREQKRRFREIHVPKHRKRRRRDRLFK